MAFYPPSVVIPVYAIFTVIGTVLLGFRLWVRVALSSLDLGADDILSVAGILFVYSCTGIQIWNNTSGTGGNFENQEYLLAQLKTSRQINAAQAVLEILAVGLIKMSLLFFFRRIFGVIPSFHRNSLICIWVIVVWMLTYSIAQLALCGTRIDYRWAQDQSIPQHNCGSKGILLLTFAVTSVLTDLIVLGLPIVYLNKVQMPSQKKLPVVLLILLGSISTFACLLRTVFLGIAVPLGTIEWNYQPKSTEQIPIAMQIFNPTFWIMVEMWVVSWVSNLLPIGPLYITMFGTQRRRARTTVGAADDKFSQSYRMGRRDKVRGLSAVEELHTGNDMAPNMGSAR